MSIFQSSEAKVEDRVLPSSRERGAGTVSRVGIVDGSNLALQRPPRADRLLQLRDDLESNDFQEVRIICDASLRWKIKDDEQHELLEAKIKSGDVQQVPAKTRADEFILSSALDWKEEGWEVFIITNDLYKEFQEDERFSWLWREDRFIRFFISRLSDDKERVHLKLEGQIERLKPASEAARLSKPAEVLSVTRYDGRYTCNKKGEVWVPVPYDMEKRTLDTPIPQRNRCLPPRSETEGREIPRYRRRGLVLARALQSRPSGNHKDESRGERIP